LDNKPVLFETRGTLFDVSLLKGCFSLRSEKLSVFFYSERERTSIQGNRVLSQKSFFVRRNNEVNALIKHFTLRHAFNFKRFR